MALRPEQANLALIDYTPKRKFRTNPDTAIQYHLLDHSPSFAESLTVCQPALYASALLLLQSLVRNLWLLSIIKRRVEPSAQKQLIVCPSNQRLALSASWLAQSC